MSSHPFRVAVRSHGPEVPYRSVTDEVRKGGGVACAG
jgi:hypothetical protein